MDKLGEHGHETVPTAPNTRPVNTLMTGEGIAEVLEGAAVVVDSRRLTAAVPVPPPASRRQLDLPLAVGVTGGNRNDVSQLIPLVDAVPPILGRRGRPRHRSRVLVGDCAYDHDKYATCCAGAAPPRGSHAAASMSETPREEHCHDCPQPDRP